MEMKYVHNGKTIQYQLMTDPAEAQYWTTHRLKKSEIKILTKCDRSTAALLREEILNDIISREPNPSKKSQAPKNEIQERRKSSKPQHVKARQTKQKARR